jgi:hypothetical protein
VGGELAASISKSRTKSTAQRPGARRRGRGALSADRPLHRSMAEHHAAGAGDVLGVSHSKYPPAFVVEHVNLAHPGVSPTVWT